MRFGILGPLEVADEGGRGVVLGGRRQRSVLAILLLHANEVVARDRLIEELWSGQPPASAATSLHAHVSRLRRALGEERRIVTAGGGYLIRVAGGELDRDRFERLVEEGAGAISRGDWELGSGRLREALSLWRGPPLSDFAYDSFAQAEIARLEELHVGAVERRIEAELALGREPQVVGDLERLVREHPYRERLRGQLMLALYRTGRQADALAAYQAARRTLVDELGIEPSAELRELEQGILRHDPSLSPAAQTPPLAAGYLPVPATPFLGRARELAEVTTLLRDADRRLVTLTGAGGSGKTRLALQAAQACSEEFPGGAWFVGFADLTDPGLIAPAICQAIGLADQPDLTPGQRLEGYLRDRELLLVLDNLEQLTPGVSVLGELLAGCPGVRMLVTSREPLHLAGEQQYEVPVLDREDAIKLFVARAGAVTPGVNIDRDVAGAICERLDRLPLAIELAAARTKALSPAEILARLERHLPVLATGPRDAPRRQRTLQATIDWSCELLSEKEQRLFIRLAVFAGGCTLEAAEAVCDAELDTLGALIDRSLLRYDGARYSMLQTMREHALEKLELSNEAAELRRRQAMWFVDLLEVEALGVHAPGISSATVLAPERENFRTALEYAAENGRFEITARLAAPLSWSLWIREGQLQEAQRWLGLAHERRAEYPPSVQGNLLSAERQLAWRRGETNEAEALCEQALSIYRKLDDPVGICHETINRGVLASERGDPVRARAALEQAIAIARDRNVTGFVPTALVYIAEIAIHEECLDEAQAACESCLTLLDDPALTADTRTTALTNLAHIANLQLRQNDAAVLARQALAAALDRADKLKAASAAIEIAWALAEQGQPDRSGRLLGSATEIIERAGAIKRRTELAAEQAVRNRLLKRLDEQALQLLLHEGRNMSLEDAAKDELQETKLAPA